jgi:MoaA/NifB/PqqE/SkfB family radical SAM enzyme
MSAFDLHLNYRGPLSSCNYDCDYCPFAKHVSSREELQQDQQALTRFVHWCESHIDRRLSILFTPWGEGLIRRWYPEAMLKLAQLPHVVKVAIQTNLSSRLDWLDALESPNMPPDTRESLGFWATYHPTQIEIDRFVARCHELDARAVGYSVGIVGLREHFDAIVELRRRLHPRTYLWINAYKSAGPGYYSACEREWLAGIDPLFEHNAIRHRTLGQPCAAGDSALFVRGDGNVSRCHFVDELRGNLYRDPLAQLLRREPCPQHECGCFIGYVHLDRLGLRARFGSGLAERRLTS